MNGIKGQQKGTTDEKKKNMALDIVAAVYVTMESKVKNYDTPKFSWDMYLIQRSQIIRKISDSFEFDAVENSNLNNNGLIIMYLQYDKTHRL